MVDYQRVVAALNRPARSLGVLPELAALRPRLTLHVYETLPSTNQHAWTVVEQGHGAGTVVIAAQQTAGRGQRGRTWVSPPGGLYLSLVLEPNLPVSDRLLLTLATAWGVKTSLANLGIPLQLKWPNDLVSEGDKVGGILVESRLGTSATETTAASIPCLKTVVVGLGLNWDNPLPAAAKSVRQLLPDPASAGLDSLEDLAAIAVRGLLQGYDYWQHRGTDALVRAYQQSLSHLGRSIIVDGHSGQVAGVSSTGELTVNMGGGDTDQKITRTFKPGEIRLGYNI